MSDGIKVEIVGADRLVAKFDSFSEKLRGSLKTTMDYVVNYLAEYCRANKLSGQVLHRRTGTLSRSIRGFVTENANQITGQVTSRAGGNAPLEYAAFWELGFRGAETVRAHVRRTVSGGSANVREHIRNVNQAARPYLRPTRDENVGFVQTQMQMAVKKANQ